MRFTRIKVTPVVVELDWSTTDATGDKRTTTLESKARPMPALTSALAAFRPYVSDLLGLPAEWAEATNITTLNIDEGKDGRLGLIVTCLKPVEKAANRPLVLNTPQMREPMGDGDAEMFLPEDIVVLIRQAEVAATAYVNGEREQVEMELNPPEGAEPPKRGRRAKKGSEVVGSITTTSLDEADLRSRLMSRGRDVPLDAVQRWTAHERADVIAWLDGIGGDVEPLPLVRDATPALLDDLIAADAGMTPIGDVVEQWTQENPPPKASEVEAPT